MVSCEGTKRPRGGSGKTTPQSGNASLRKRTLTASKAGDARTNQPKADGARTGCAARLAKTQVTDNSGGAVVINGTATAVAKTGSSSRSTVSMISANSINAAVGTEAKDGS